MTASMTSTTLDDDAQNLGLYARQAYLEYALSVVKGRALPDLRDGQKPVQRRIVYAMQRMGLGFGGSNGSQGARPVKSARVVGDVLGRFHPHGDQAAYDALVRMAQDFSQRYPLIDGQGNFGSRDGDGAAAMRYTEARLAPIARLLLDEIDDGTVDFIANYDGSTEEPSCLPARLPFVLLNGASGIAVGLATEIAPHNLDEVAQACVLLLRNRLASLDEVMAVLPGPDFPGGGQIISPAADIAEVYRSGRGSLKVRARWTVEELARGQWQLVVTELPPGTSSQRVLQDIEEATNPRLKAGKKTLSSEQTQIKAVVLGALENVRDESSKDAPVRLVFEPRSRNQSPDEFARILLAHTGLEGSVALNFTMIGVDGRPVQKALLTVLHEWLDERLAVMRRRCRHRLGQIEARLHILEGRHTVLLHIDEVIAIIRESDEPKAALMARFALSERQADDILEIRLRQLARLEFIKIEQEMAKLKAEKEQLEALLGSDDALRRQLIHEIKTDAKQFADARRTLIQAEKRTVLDVRVVDEPVTVVVSDKGWLRALKGHEVQPSGLSFKPGDSLYGTFACRSVDTLLALGSDGRVYSVPVAQLPGGRGDGQPVTALADIASGTRISHYVAGSADTRLLLASSAGYGLLADIADMVSRQKAGKQFLTLDDGASLLRPEALRPGQSRVACLSRSGRLLVYALSEIKHQPKGGKGLTLMAVDEGDPLIAATPFARVLGIAGLLRGGREREDLIRPLALQKHAGVRARKGRVTDTMQKPLRLWDASDSAADGPGSDELPL
ncbi:DNA topoisomerase IV subunit A [Amphibiibacter pelophylacis]|uniref:DNA topoisomerase IV subunit A n=1 Tax=Amphibiibacter pelophylacis TaxID=1799477 RepID=A0ACC6P4E0_9BURK